MKPRPHFFLSPERIDHDGIIFDYIGELHEYLWQFVRAEFPQAKGNLNLWLDLALRKSKKRREAKELDKKIRRELLIPE